MSRNRSVTIFLLTSFSSYLVFFVCSFFERTGWERHSNEIFKQRKHCHLLFDMYKMFLKVAVMKKKRKNKNHPTACKTNKAKLFFFFSTTCKFAGKLFSQKCGAYITSKSYRCLRGPVLCCLRRSVLYMMLLLFYCGCPSYPMGALGKWVLSNCAPATT